MSEATPLLDDLRVIDLSTRIAGPYCTKVLADAGADVVKVESPTGDPLRRWSTSGTVPADQDGALFQYLNGSKRSVIAAWGSPQLQPLLAGAHLLVESGQLTADDRARLRSEHPHLSVVSLSPFGTTGPWADRPATEFTLQALAGSIAARGTADREPLFAGGHLGEWIGGIVAAVAAASVLRGYERTGRAEHVDVSLLEAMTMMMGGYQSVHATLGAAPAPVPRRSIELPSVEPTADGYVGFCTITAQQFQDFLLMIDRPDLIDDAELARGPGRQGRRTEFLDLVHAWSTQRTTDEIIDFASALRIPISPVGTPADLPDIDHFAQRGVFVDQPGGAFRRPRVPYRVDDASPRIGPAPRLGQHDGAVHWPPTATATAAATAAAGPASSGPAPSLPLDGVRIVDLTAFWAGPAATHLLAALGADVIKVESPRRPDGIRMVASRSPDQPSWWEWSSIFQAVNVNKRDVTLDLNTDEGRQLLLDLVGRADVLVENFSPRVLDSFGLTREALAAANPRLITARMPAFGLDGPWRDRVGFAQTMEQASGLAWMTGFADGPPMIPRGVCDPLAGLHAAFAIIAAVRERDRSGHGHFLECTMVESALSVAAEMMIEHDAYGVSLHRDGNRGPTAAPQGVYRCAGEEAWIALAVETNDDWRRFAAAIGSPPWATDERFATVEGRRSGADELDARIAGWMADRDLPSTVELISGAGVAVASVLCPEDVLDLDQLHATGFVERVTHPLIGEMDLLGIPFRFVGRDEPWLRHPAPTLGQHNHDVLGDLLGLSDARIHDLEQRGVISDRLVYP